MEEMKGDMGGAANVIALMAAVAATKPQVEVHGLLGCAENMPDGDAYRPGDVFGSLDGKTVEIINTDAEGRLILGDALWYAQQLGATHLVDIATLTGVRSTGVGGHTASGLFGAPDTWVETVRRRRAPATGSGPFRCSRSTKTN
jgi:leucyl aminopeptidase